MTNYTIHREGKNGKSRCGRKDVEITTGGVTNCKACNNFHNKDEVKALAIWKEAMALLETR